MKIASRMAVVGALSLLLCAPVADAAAAKPRAKVRTLTGHVMAAPFENGRRVMVPVLVDRKSARRAKLRAPVGILVLKKSRKVAVKGQRTRVAPLLLRAGDRLRARARVTRTARRGVYWTMRARKFSVIKRSATFNPAEMQQALAGFGSDLDRVETALAGLAKYVQGGFTKTAGDIAALRSGVTALSVALRALTQRVSALEAGLPAMEARLKAQIDALAADLDALETQMAALQTQLAGLAGDLAALEGDVAQLQADMAAAQAAIAQLTADVAALQAAVGALCGSGSPVGGLC